VVSGTRAQYAKCGDIDIAYQVLGEGPIDLLLFTGMLIPINCLDDDPSMARFQRRLASFARLLRFDIRGVGLSDRGSPSSPPTEEDWVQDALAVLDAVGSEHAAVLAPFFGSPLGLRIAAMHPERIDKLVIVNGSARVVEGPDYPQGLSPAYINELRLLTRETDAVEQGLDILALFAPSVSDDQVFRSWWDRSGNLAATPAMAQVITAEAFETDVRDVLPHVHVPTLIIQRTENPLLHSGHGTYLAEHLPDARLVPLPGADLLYWTGDTRALLDEIEEFVTGVRGGSGSERALSTVLFTDIVASTDRAVQLGDQSWRDLLDRHDTTVRAQIARFRGHEVKTVGDGFLATFDSPGRAVDCAQATREALRALGVEIRAGIHTGEIEVRGDDVAGLAVHIGARVSAVAGAGELLVSSTVRDLLAGSGFEFEDRGEHELKGVPGTWKIFVVRG
jgi:class 3 adenylate cyclase